MAHMLMQACDTQAFRYSAAALKGAECSVLDSLKAKRPGSPRYWHAYGTAITWLSCSTMGRNGSTAVQVAVWSRCSQGGGHG